MPKSFLEAVTPRLSISEALGCPQRARPNLHAGTCEYRLSWLKVGVGGLLTGVAVGWADWSATWLGPFVLCTEVKGICGLDRRT